MTVNVILLLYNKYINRLYFTPSNITTPLLGVVVGERHLPANSPDNYVYRNVTKKTIKGIISDDVNVSHLEILITDIGGRSLETVVDDAGKRRSIKDTLISIGKDPNMIGRRMLFSRAVLISQEPTRYPVNNPIEAVIDNQELLNEIQV